MNLKPSLAGLRNFLGPVLALIVLAVPVLAADLKPPTAAADASDCYPSGVPINGIGVCWTQSPSPEVTNYLVEYGVASGAYTGSITTGNDSQILLTNLDATQKYFIVVIALDAKANESAPTSEVSTYPYHALAPATEPKAVGSDAPPPHVSRLENISARALVQTGDNVLIGGFIISGDTSKRIVTRAIGPTLTDYGLSGVLQNPTLQVYNAAGQVIASNSDWQADASAAQLVSLNLAPKSALESALIGTYPPGAYTVIVRGTATQTGIALVEIYDVDDRAPGA